MLFRCTKLIGGQSVILCCALAGWRRVLVASTVLLCHFQGASVFAQTAGEMENERDARKHKLRQERMRNDMLYGTDNYFGANRDAWYADMARPTPEKKVEVAPAASVSTESNASSRDDDDEEEDDDSSSSSGSTTPASPGGSTPPTTTPDTPPPPVEPPPPPPDPPPGGG